MSSHLITTEDLTALIRAQTQVWLKQAREKKLSNLPWPQLAIIQGNQNPATNSYLKVKQKAAETLGIGWHLYQPKNHSDLLESITWLNNDDEIQGYLIQLPLAEKLLEQRTTKDILQQIKGNKDIENLSEKNDLPPVFARALVLGYLYLKKIQLENLSQTDSKDIQPVQPEKIWTVTNPDLKQAITRELKRENIIFDWAESINSASVVFTASGKTHSILAKDLSPKCLIVDGGIEKVNPAEITQLEDPTSENSWLAIEKSLGKTIWAGDFDQGASDPKKELWATAVPGGIGPLTVEVMFNNLAKLVLSQTD